ncbi:MAG: radical SAM protein [Oscillospiraceae bacterium]
MMKNDVPLHGNLAIFVPHLGCAQRCSYCDQRAISGENDVPTATEVRALCAQALLKSGSRHMEMAFFGGSFTAVRREYTRPLLEAAAEFLGHGISGIRISTRPDAIDGEQLDFLRKHGVTAIELGAQSMDDHVLKKNGRGHTAEQTCRASALIREWGFELGLQLMTGLDGADETSDLMSARALADLRPDTTRIYPTLVLKDTDLALRYMGGYYRPPTLSEAVSLVARVMELFDNQDIRIIRVGLHDTSSMRAALIAGPWHPAFRELCEGELMRQRLLLQLGEHGGGEIIVAVRPEDVSRMIGHKKRNAGLLAQQGFRLSVRAVPGEKALWPRLLTA